MPLQSRTEGLLLAGRRKGPVPSDFGELRLELEVMKASQIPQGSLRCPNVRIVQSNLTSVCVSVSMCVCACECR